MKTNETLSGTKLGGQFTFPKTLLTVHRGYGALQLAGPKCLGRLKIRKLAVAVLRQAIAAGVNHIGTSDIYGPHITHQRSVRGLDGASRASDLHAVLKL